MAVPVVLHACCAPCSAAIVEWLLQNNYHPILYYFNPNIYPEPEYLLRKNECVRYARFLDLEMVDADYQHDSWLCGMQGMETEPERGKRCLQCFKFRLLATARFAAERGVQLFSTTLASSRWKSLPQIEEAGRWAANQVGQGVQFWEKNWRKGGLQQRRHALLKSYAFYNQTYCGCEFSVRS